jgi:3'(2'), 5'-bisphosphate nucleotidase
MYYVSPEQAQAIRDLIRDCGQQAKQMAADGFKVFEKGKDDYVTTADRALDQRLSQGFAALFPNDGIVTEENARSRRDFHEEGQRCWFIDPIDGTEDFIHGGSHYAVMVGLVEADVPVAGWIYAPAIERFYYGGDRWGLFQVTGDRLPEALIPVEPPPPSADFCPIMIGDRDYQQFGEVMTEAVPGISFRSLGSFGLKVMEVVRGHAGLYIYLNRRVKLWDTTGPIALAKAAGLVCCDLEGHPFEFTAEVVDADTLTHHQTVVIGWPSYVEALRGAIAQAVAPLL